MSVEGVRVLIVEDEAIIAMTAEDMLEELGFVTAAVASTLAEAEAAVARGNFDVVLLDINLNGVESLPVAARLEAAGLPFIFTTGYGAGGRDSRYAGVPLVTKPYQPRDLAEAIAKALGR